MILMKWHLRRVVVVQRIQILVPEELVEDAVEFIAAAAGRGVNDSPVARRIPHRNFPFQS